MTCEEKSLPHRSSMGSKIMDNSTQRSGKSVARSSNAAADNDAPVNHIPLYLQGYCAHACAQTSAPIVKLVFSLRSVHKENMQFVSWVK